MVHGTSFWMWFRSYLTNISSGPLIPCNFNIFRDSMATSLLCLTIRYFKYLEDGLNEMVYKNKSPSRGYNAILSNGKVGNSARWYREQQNGTFWKLLVASLIQNRGHDGTEYLARILFLILPWWTLRNCTHSLNGKETMRSRSVLIYSALMPFKRRQSSTVSVLSVQCSVSRMLPRYWAHEMQDFLWSVFSNDRSHIRNVK